SVVTRAELARHAVHGSRVKRGAAGHLESRRRHALLDVDPHLRDRHRWYRPHIVRIYDVEDRLRDFGKLVVDLQMDARGEEREGLDEPLDMRILAFRRLELQPARDLRISLRELRPHPADVRELSLVVVEKV